MIICPIYTFLMLLFYFFTFIYKPKQTELTFQVT